MTQPGTLGRSWPGWCATTTRPRRGDEPRRLLGRGADPARATRWSPRWASCCPGSARTGRGSWPRCRWPHAGSGEPSASFRPVEALHRPLVVASPDSRMRTEVAIVGAGPAGLLLAHLLAADGIESVVVESRSQEYVASRIRAGILEQSTVDLLRGSGLGDRLEREGDEHHGIYLQWPQERHHVDFVGLTGRSVWVYGQTEVQKDLVAAAQRARTGDPLRGERHRAPRPRAPTGRRSPSPTPRASPGGWRPTWSSAATARSDRPAARCPSRCGSTWEKVYPYSWLGVLADVAPSTDELIYAWHPDGFAMHSMRSADRLAGSTCRSPTRPPIDDWSDDRIWDALATRLGHGQDGWTLTPGPITEKSRAADALVRADADAARPAVPGRRRRAHRAADRRQGAQPRGRRRRRCSRRPWSPAAQGGRGPRRRRTPTPRCAGSGAARTSRGG